MDNMTDFFVLLIGIALVLFFLIVLLVKFIVEVYVPFIGERDFIKSEIMRSYGEGRERWQRELKRLYISAIPLVGGYFAVKFMEKNKK